VRAAGAGSTTRAAEFQLLGGGVANRGRVLRSGGTVRRPVAPFREATHALLRHLESAGFGGSPRLLAAEADVEVLSWIPGRAACTPLPDWSLDDQTLLSVAELIRRFHRAVADFDPTGYRWPRRVPAGYRGGLVSHNDLHPGNIVFESGTAVGLIDFDLAGPGCVSWDLATVVRCWCPLAADCDVPAELLDTRLSRLALFLHGYGLQRAARIAVVEALLPNHDWTYRIVTDAVRSGHPGFQDYWNEVARRTERARDWTLRHRQQLIQAVR
jgi:hypothetical protein